MKKVFILGWILHHSLLATANTTVLKVGIPVPLSGETKFIGESIKKGMDLFLDDLKTQDVKLAEKIQVAWSDSSASPKGIDDAMQQMLGEQNVDVVIAPPLSISAHQVLLNALDKKKIVLVPFVSTLAMKRQDENIFRLSHSYSYQSVVLAQFAKNNLNRLKAAVLYEEGSQMGLDAANAFSTSFRDAGGEVVIQKTFLSDGSNMNTALRKIIAKGPRTIFIPAIPEFLATIIHELEELKYPTPLLGLDVWDELKTETLALPTKQKIYHTTQFYRENSAEINQSFQKKYVEKYQEEPNQLAALSYEAGQIIQDAISKTKSFKTTALISALENVDANLLSGHFKFEKNHDAIKPLNILEISNQKRSFSAQFPIEQAPEKNAKAN